MAARGTDGRRYPWGDTWDSGKCSNSVANHHPGKTSPVGSFPQGASPYGVLDMAGNVYQWCADMYEEHYYAHSPAKNPSGPATDPTNTRMLRGGSWFESKPRDLRATSRLRSSSGIDEYSGFRCVVPVKL
jgi:formylglycine-generating enzyme required for sulfatase activity